MGTVPTNHMEHFGQDYLLANGGEFDNGWAARRADIMERASVNATLKDSDKVERRLKCQQEEFLGCLKQHETDKLTLGKYLQELEAKNCVLEDEKAELQGKLEIIQERAENYKLALDEFKEERESLLKYWKQDQQKLAKLVGPDYDNVSLADVRLMDLTTVESLAAEQNRKLGEGVQEGLSTFQKRMQARTKNLQASLANEKSAVFRMNADGTLEKAPDAVPSGEVADSDQTQCYWSPMDGCYHVLGEEEKLLAAKAGAKLAASQVLNQESDEVRRLSRRVAELEYSATLSGSSLEEIDALQTQLHATSAQCDGAKLRAETAEALSARTRIELENMRASGGAGGGANDGQIASLQTQLQQMQTQLELSSEEKNRLKTQHAKEKDMFMGIADGLGREVTETQRALAAVFESYPHLKNMVQEAMPAGGVAF